MKNLKEERLELEKLASEAILLNINNNFFKCENKTFKAFGKGSSCGTWFKCGEEEIERLRTAILSGNFEVKKKIPNNSRIYRLPSEWMEKEKET